ncbi:DUF3368 domain-containing protein [Thiothrix lacustris]|uniref:DUF3368 domain-containing protein n=1 Tax=Thiothrix lacustris TaxID=525917 RepID=UPI0027E3FFE0|nr:DUF3368 domain-containing protein [Thiothrix lacustris]WMP19024.1 DUF3368 domain-containing protein [Thiothrix lacustris]
MSSYRGLDLLETLFGTVLVPTAVHDEVCAQGKPQADALKAYLVGKVQKVDMSQCKLQKTSGLGNGELEAMALYKATSANLMLVDDLRAKKSAYTNGLETMGSLGLLLLAKEEGLIADITSRVRLLQNSNAYLNPLLIEQVLQRAGE